MMKTIFINHSERPSDHKMSQESYRMSYKNGRESMMSTAKHQGMEEGNNKIFARRLKWKGREIRLW